MFGGNWDPSHWTYIGLQFFDDDPIEELLETFGLELFIQIARIKIFLASPMRSQDLF